MGLRGCARARRGSREFRLKVNMDRLRILILAPDANPESISMSFVTYRHAAAHAELHDVTLVVGPPSEAPIRRDSARFRGLEVIRMPWVERFYAWSLRKIFKGNFNSQAWTAFLYPFSIAFEWTAWRQLRRRIKAGEFDVVLRVMPMSTVLPSPFAFFLRKGPIPFVIGPLNGGLPWPPGFQQLERQRQSISGLRNVYRHLPFAQSTYRDASAIIAASSQTYSQFPEYRDKLFFVFEPGIGPSTLCSREPRGLKAGDKLQIIFVGALLPLKACNLALRAAADLLKSDRAFFTIIGDGPERGALEELAKSLGIEKAVDFRGWISHEEVLAGLQSADLMLFPSLKENGGGVVFEALAKGAVPLVVDFGGPGDIVHPEVGFKVPLTNEDDVVVQIEKILTEIAANPAVLDRLRERGMLYAREQLTWEAKARAVTRVLEWAVKRGPKPNLPPPKLLPVGVGSSQ